MILAHCNLPIQVEVILVPQPPNMHHHAWLIFVFLGEIGFHHVGQCGLELLASSDLPALAPKMLGLQV